jgi:hypothetical protein
MFILINKTLKKFFLLSLHAFLCHIMQQGNQIINRQGIASTMGCPAPAMTIISTITG